MSFDLSILIPHGLILKPALLSIVVYGGRYVLFASMFYLMAKFKFGRADRAEYRTTQTKKNRHAQLVRERIYSFSTILVFTLVTVVLFGYGFVSHSHLYWKIEQHGWLWFWVSIPVMLIMHDTFFYWLHRLFHSRILYRGVHRLHHLSIHPTAWAAYSFHPIEAVFEVLITVAIFFIMPVFPVAFLIFQTISALLNVYVHCGREFYPAGWESHWFGRWINTSVAHHTHHATGRDNYGLYFLFWDRMMGTLDKTYR